LRIKSPNEPFNDLNMFLLTDLSETKISFSKQNNHYIAQAFIPFNQERIRITARIDDEMYKGKDDPRLIEKGGKLIKEKIRSQFPDHFRDEESKG